MPPIFTVPYDAAAYLKTEEECTLYLQAVAEEANGDATMIDMALARSKFDPARNPLGSNPSA